MGRGKRGAESAWGSSHPACSSCSFVLLLCRWALDLIGVVWLHALPFCLLSSADPYAPSPFPLLLPQAQLQLQLDHQAKHSLCLTQSPVAAMAPSLQESMPHLLPLLQQLQPYF